LKRGDKGINALDAACREHGTIYSQFKDLKNRHRAENIYADRTWERVKAKDSDLKEHSAAWLTKKNKSHHRRRKRKSFGNKKYSVADNKQKKIIRKHCE